MIDMKKEINIKEIAGKHLKEIVKEVGISNTPYVLAEMSLAHCCVMASEFMESEEYQKGFKSKKGD